MSINLPIFLKNKPLKYGCSAWVKPHNVYPKDGDPYHRKGHFRNYNCSDKQPQDLLQDMVKEFQDTSCR